MDVILLFYKVALLVLIAFADPEVGGGGGRGSGLPLENHKNIVFLAILVRLPWKMTKLPSQHSLSGYHRPVGGPMMASY